MRVLLTGGTGFIGSHVLERLLAANFRVRVLIRPETLTREAGRRITGRQGIEVIAGNLLDSGLLLEATRGIDVILHLAWQWAADPASLSRPPELGQLAEANVKGAEYLLRAAVTNRVSRLVFSSSVAVYGPPGTLLQWPITEQASLMQRDYEAGTFEKDYMEPKIAIENMIRCFSSAHELEYVILRPSVVYGADAPFAEEMVQNALEKRSARRKEGTQQRQSESTQSRCQWVHVSDVARAVVSSMTAPAAANKEINIAGDDVATVEEINDLIYAAASDFQLHLPVTDRPNSQLCRALGYESRRYDLTQAKVCLDFTPAVSLCVGIAETVFAVMRSQTPDAQPNNIQTNNTQKNNTHPAISSGMDPLLPAPQNRNKERGRLIGATPASPLTNGHIPNRAFKPTDIGAIYDEKIDRGLLEAFFGHSDFWNFGYRGETPVSPWQACENLLEKLLAWIPNKQGTILDVACGKGATARHLLRYYRPDQVFGINISPKQLERCRMNAPGCHFLVMDATNLKFAEGSFDNILCVEAAFHFNTRQKFLQEARRVLKPGGRLVLSDMMLPPWVQTQPAANFVHSLEIYREQMSQLGFGDVAVVDATEACWGRFSEDLQAFAYKQLYTGAISRQDWEELMSWLHHLSPLYYVLASCRKD